MPRLLAYILGLGCLAQPFSRAAPVTPPSIDDLSPVYDPTSIDDVDEPAIYFPSHGDPPGLRNSTYAIDPQTLDGFDSDTLEKRDSRVGYLATSYRDHNNQAGWEIQVIDPNLPRLPNGAWYILGRMTKDPQTAIANGAQGTVFLGSWSGYDKPVSSLELHKESPNCPEEAALKLSPGKTGYNIAEIMAKIASKYIVDSYAHGLQKTNPKPWFGKHVTTWSVVVFERLSETAWDMRHRYWDFDRAALFRALMQGLIDARNKGYINMDVKLENIMIKDPETRNEWAVWKIIDWDMLKLASQTNATTSMGTMGYVAPEVFDNRLGYNPEKAMVFSAGMAIYYARHYYYAKAIHPIEGWTEGFGHEDVRWFWAALVRGVDKEAVRQYLPDEYQHYPDLAKWVDFYSSVLCKEEQRASLDEMWASLKNLMPSIEEPPDPDDDPDEDMDDAPDDDSDDEP